MFGISLKRSEYESNARNMNQTLGICCFRSEYQAFIFLKPIPHRDVRHYQQLSKQTRRTDFRESRIIPFCHKTRFDGVSILESKFLQRYQFIFGQKPSPAGKPLSFFVRTSSLNQFIQTQTIIRLLKGEESCGNYT
jgi:hypothetical protein